MPIIASEMCEPDEQDDSKATYHVEMQDFLAKQRSTKWGVGVMSKSFTVSWSSFRFNIYVSGTKPEDAEIVIFLHNDETWSVKVKVSLSTDFGGMFSGPTMYLLRPNTSVCVGFLDHDRIETVPLLGLDGSLRFHFQVQVIIRPGSS